MGITDSQAVENVVNQSTFFCLFEFSLSVFIWFLPNIFISYIDKHRFGYIINIQWIIIINWYLHLRHHVSQAVLGSDV